jgi:imidazole glycerol-phosphate synthase subunit HisH
MPVDWFELMNKVVVVDYGMGNLRSVHNKFRKLAVDCTISADLTEIKQADALILPGVGHYGRAMDRLRQLGLLDMLHDRVLGDQVPVMGICLGMQLLMEGSEEGDAEGLGWIKGKAVRFQFDALPNRKIPHIGWNSVRHTKRTAAVTGVPDETLFYFVHSYHVELADAEDALHETRYGYNFISALQRGSIFGFQYHPEKSQDAGMLLMKNFVDFINTADHVSSARHSVPVIEK